MDMRVAKSRSELDIEKLSMKTTESDEAPSAAKRLDAAVMSMLARNSHGASSLAFSTAAFDWASHMAIAPGTQLEVMGEAARIGTTAWADAAQSVMQAPAETRAGAIMDMPFDIMRRSFEHWTQWIDRTADAAPGVSRKTRDLVRFAGHQISEPFCPDNYLLTNREALTRTYRESGSNLVRGWMNYVSDAAHAAGIKSSKQADTSAYEVGGSLAATPGRVVYRNRLIELIQYTPMTGKVRPEPILITPAWIMKYYILDLSAQNSLVRYLVSQGFTVFMISWKNPDADDADLNFDDYRQLGVLSALDAVTALMPEREIHAVGYCLGGTLLAITAAAMARDGDERLASLTLFAAQTDFRDPGELGLFIDEDQLHFLEASMEDQGYLDARQMASAFAMLRSRDLIWKRQQKLYLHGEQEQTFDLMVWNADSTRMPPRMHSEYLRRLFLNNDFVQGRFDVDGRPAAVSDIRAPIFALGTEKDHVAPWRSVFKIHLFADTEVTFALTSGGHNAGVVSEPGRSHRRHRILTKADSEHFVSPEKWLDQAEARDGSWWPSWVAWLEDRSGEAVDAPRLARADLKSNHIANGSELDAAPGRYVFLD